MILPTEEEKQHCLRVARASITDSPLPEPIAFTLQTLPCFVSLHSRGHRLRGCIGCVITTDTLYDNLVRLAKAAAFEDPRFPPVRREEMKDLQLEVSILGPMVPLEDWSGVVIGHHGLKVSYQGRQGLLLAQVATQYGWSVDEFRKETCDKAGLPADQWQRYQWYCFQQTEFKD